MERVPEASLHVGHVYMLLGRTRVIDASRFRRTRKEASGHIIRLVPSKFILMLLLVASIWVALSNLDPCQTPKWTLVKFRSRPELGNARRQHESKFRQRSERLSDATVKLP